MSRRARSDATRHGRWWWWDRQDPGISPALAPCAPLFAPHVRRPDDGREDQRRWRVDLDVAHFSPEEISVRVRDGFLQVAGRHEEKPDRHGFISRCFTWKYKWRLRLR
ncbi:heat shock protein beta-1-like isoform X2 [Phyllopteryx taeniolatus]|uniref:heat shock protein beta-1-like isoform X2 n=1 Tax=Phyllopteryx taeniolatus TaxID=161469 RepID=UPI002AD42D97|nr:heat shock protein beta-1-like isoform X2 [Phyllopteryx taeniolatus]